MIDCATGVWLIEKGSIFFDETSKTVYITNLQKSAPNYNSSHLRFGNESDDVTRVHKNPYVPYGDGTEKWIPVGDSKWIYSSEIDGTDYVFTTKPDNTQTFEYRDGRTQTTLPDNTKTIKDPDGKETFYDADGNWQSGLS